MGINQNKGKLKLTLLFIGLAALMALLMACNNKEPTFTDPADVVIIRDLTINTSISHQTISGFGGANQMWGTQFPSAEDIEKAFSTDENGLGFSLFRVRIPNDPSEWPLIVDVAKAAQSYGAKILASPWSPPPSLKSNNDAVGGHLLPENYGAFVEHINDYLSFMDENGVDINAVSVQNEPDIEVGYESSDWVSIDMRDFIKEYGDQINARLAAPESFNFSHSFSNPILNDEEAVANLDIVAGHIYGGGQNPYPLAEEKGKEIWMTEYLLNLNTGNSGATPWAERSDEDKWDETFEMLETVHTAMINNWNAYIWWYLKRYYSFIGDGTEGTTEGEILKRGYAFSHFSKFVRPGYTRVDVDFSSTHALQISAFHGEGKTVLVLLNNGNTKVTNINLIIDGEVAPSAIYYTTSLNIDRQKTEVQIAEGRLLIDAAPGSITTVVIED